jgi:Fe-S cluster assembly ATPase SufC
MQEDRKVLLSIKDFHYSIDDHLILKGINLNIKAVELVTSEGDRLNLKSKLSQYIMLTKVFSEAKIDEMELLVSEPEDMRKLLDYLIRG